VLTAGKLHLFRTGRGAQAGIKLDNVFADDQQHSKMLVKDAEITIGASAAIWSRRRGRDGAADTGSAPASRWPANARFVPFPALPTAPEMAGNVPPEDETLYVAADGTGDFYSIQRALDAAPKDGALVLVAPGTYREVLTIDKPNIRLRSANSDAARQSSSMIAARAQMAARFTQPPSM
jgi:polygalacturonase